MNAMVNIGVQAERDRAHGRALLEGIAKFASAHDDWRLELLEPGRFASRAGLGGYDGFIVRVMDDRTARVLADTGKPVVDTYGRTDAGPFSTIRLDDKGIAVMAARYFADRLFRDCAYCGFAGVRFSAERGRCFREECGRLGMRCLTYSSDSAAIVTDTFFQNERIGPPPDAGELTKWIAALPPQTAVFCCNDLRALQLARACLEARVEIPKDVAILGVDNDTLLCSFCPSPLSSIDTSPAELGYRAGEILHGMLSRGDRAAMRLHPPMRVVERSSTDIFRSSVPWFSSAMRHIVRNIPNGVNATDIFRHAGLSQTTVNKVFLAETGRTVKQEILRRRLDLSCRLLREGPGLTAAEVAARSGFSSPQHFSKSFSAAFGMPPDAWRARNGSGL